MAVIYAAITTAIIIIIWIILTSFFPAPEEVRQADVETSTSLKTFWNEAERQFEQLGNSFDEASVQATAVFDQQTEPTPEEALELMN